MKSDMVSGINFRSATGIALMALVAAGSTACDKVPLLAPTNSTITLTATTRVLPLGGSTEVTAVVIEQAGTPVQNGTAVRFVTSLGTVNPVEVETHNGIATATFLAGDVSGVAEVRALSGGAGSTGSTSSGAAAGGAAATTPTAANVVQITIGAAAVDSVTVRTNPATVSANGGTVDVIASVLGAGGRTLSGVTVTFSADHGTLSATSAVTDANGEARVQLTTNVDTTVTATAGGKTAAAGAKVVALAAPAITLTCTSSSSSNCSTMNVGDVAVFTASRAAGTSNIRSATLDFGDGSQLDLGNLSGTVTASHQYTQAGAYTVRLIATDVNGEVATSTLIVLVQEQVIVTVTLNNPSGHRVEATATIIGCTPQRYDWNFGNGANPSTISTTNNSASTTYTAGGTKTVIVSVRCTDGRTAQSSGQVEVQLP